MKQGPITGHRAAQSAEYKILLIYLTQLGLFQNMFHNFLKYTKRFCFWYITLSCFFETFPAGRPAGWFENLILVKNQKNINMNL